MFNKPPSTDEVREIATAYGLECVEEGTRPSYSEMSRRLGRNPRWLTQCLDQYPHRLVCRNITTQSWISVGTLSPINVEAEEDMPGLPDDYPVGDALLEVLSDPGRLDQFCRLTLSGGIRAALVYAQWQHQRCCHHPTAKV